MTDYTKHFSERETPQSEPIPFTAQVPNSAGGFTWKVDDWTRLDRFLILGAEGGTFYVGERKLTVENAEAVLRCITVDGLRTVARIVEVSKAGRAPKNDPAIFALALAASKGDVPTRRAAFAAIPEVCRIGTHLFHFVRDAEAFRGWGKGFKRAVARWYEAMPVDRLAYQAIKYQQREGWGHRDLVRLSHPKPDSSDRQAVLLWMAGEPRGPKGTEERLRHLKSAWMDGPGRPALLDAFEHVQRATEEGVVTSLIREHRLPREAVPSQRLDRPAVWEALLEDMPMTAMVRNLATMTRVGLLAPLGAATKHVVEELANRDRIRKARVHPLALLLALRTYASGKGVRGQHTWTPVQSVCDALDGAFYLAFENAEPTGKRLVLALDVSGSMRASFIGQSGLSAREAAAAMALVIASTEKDHVIVGFYSGRATWRTSTIENGIGPLAITPKMRLDQVTAYTAGLPFGGTDCALPMLWAEANEVQADGFITLTDSETWAGSIHPSQALKQYRRATGIPAKAVCVGMTANEFTVLDPHDAGSMNCVGFDASVPTVIRDFLAT